MYIYDAYVAFYKHADAIKKKEDKENLKMSRHTAFSMSIMPLYQRFGYSTSSLVRENPWLLSLPSKVRESAVTDFMLAFRQNKAKVIKARKAGPRSQLQLRHEVQERPRPECVFYGAQDELGQQIAGIRADSKVIALNPPLNTDAMFARLRVRDSVCRFSSCIIV